MRSKAIVAVRRRESVADNRRSGTRLRAGFDDVMTAMVGDAYMLEPREVPWPKKYKSVVDVFKDGGWVWGVQSRRLNR